MLLSYMKEKYIFDPNLEILPFVKNIVYKRLLYSQIIFDKTHRTILLEWRALVRITIICFFITIAE